MHVTVLGAGALGRVYGVRLAALANVAVDFVVRAPRVEAIAIERVGGDAHRVDAPSFVTAIPPHADVVLACVRADQLGDDFVAAVRAGPSVPVVVMTPMLARTRARVAGELGARVVCAMPSVTGYTNADGVTRYWISRTAMTLFEERTPPDPALTALAGALSTAGLETQFDLAVDETSAATLIALFPLTLAVSVAGSVDALLADGPMLATMFRAASEARALADRCGKVAPWAKRILRFLGPFTIRVGVSLGRQRAPEVLAYVEAKLGRPALGQNRALGAEIVLLAEEKGSPREALSALLAW